MKNTLTSFFVICLTSILLLPDATAAFSCTISRNNASSPPLTWNNGDWSSDIKFSIYNPENCNIPAGGYITGASLSFNLGANTNILTNGLMEAEYGLQVSTSSGEVANVMATVSANGFSTIEARTTTDAFNGLDPSNANFIVRLIPRNVRERVQCKRSTANFCHNFMAATYNITLEYREHESAPDEIGQIFRTLSSGYDLSVRFDKPARAATYEWQISTADGSYYDEFVTTEPKLRTQLLLVGDYTINVKACNQYGCTTEKSTVVIIPDVPPVPKWVELKLNSFEGQNELSWSYFGSCGKCSQNVGLVYKGFYEVRVNEGPWSSSSHKVTTYNRILLGLSPGFIEARVKHCDIRNVCSDWVYTSMNSTTDPNSF